MIPVELRTSRLVLDQPGRDDIDLVTEYCQDPVFEAFMTLPWPYHRGDAEYFVEEFVPDGWARDIEYTWAIRTGGDFLGVIGVRVATGMVGFWLGAPHRGHGYMPEALNAVADWMFARGAEQLRWECVVGNTASASVARQVGFTYTGRAPTTILGRDGTAPDSWHGTLAATDPRTATERWP
jgi:RimJ/RimL family protein N-acetyltransferase